MYKQAIVVRKDVLMGRGKLAAQVAHASLSAYLKTSRKEPEIAKQWLMHGQKKIVLKAENEAELRQFLSKCEEAGIPFEIIRDAGHTQLDAGTLTCFGAGPWKDEEIDRVFGSLKLL